jgi:hypothetical protein
VAVPRIGRIRSGELLGEHGQGTLGLVRFDARQEKEAVALALVLHDEIDVARAHEEDARITVPLGAGDHPVHRLPELDDVLHRPLEVAVAAPRELLDADGRDEVLHVAAVHLLGGEKTFREEALQDHIRHADRQFGRMREVPLSQAARRPVDLSLVEGVEYGEFCFVVHKGDYFFILHFEKIYLESMKSRRGSKERSFS